jgi:hypothetical protein
MQSSPVRLRPLPVVVPSPVEDAQLVEVPEGQLVRARLFALTMLIVIAGVLGYGGYSAIRAFSDAFIAPLTLSPNSDVVLASKLKLDDLARERAQTAAELQGIDAELRANEKALRRLHELQGKFQYAADWLGKMNTHKARVGAAELSALSAQGQIAKNMLDEQRRLTRKAEDDLSAGLITRTDYAKEMQRLADLQRGMIETQRSQLQGQSNMYEVQLAERALKEQSGAPIGPQLLASQEQLVRVDLDILRLESETRAKSALREASLQRFGEVDLLTQQLKARPLFRAIQRKLELAFVPYSQLDGVVKGAEVYACAWGMFFCRSVGKISEILEGEVTQQDPWGTPARGQYAVLSLSDHDAARAKTLRVRTSSAARPRHAAILKRQPVAAAR